jgi:adiponectin receptor
MFVRSEKACEVVARLDYMGIAILFMGSAYPFISFKFACGDYFITWRYIFISLLTVSTIACIVVVMCPKLQTPVSRVVVFSCFFIAIMIPVIFLAFTYDNIYAMSPNLGLNAISLVQYAIGVFFYVSQYPERKWPGKFDYFGASHQIFHCFVLLGAFITFVASF